MSVEEFAVVINTIKPYTNYVYLHLLGEPLLHPRFTEILQIAQQADILVNITTNGSLLIRNEKALVSNSVRQINISLHDAEENIVQADWDSYMNNVLYFARQAAPTSYINLRLWNAGVTASEPFNAFCLSKIADFFDFKVDDLKKEDKDTGVKLADHIFLQTALRFDWPDGETHRNEQRKTCYALRDQIAILADGTVVPCCLDANGAMNLGNIFTDNFETIINSERADKIRKGFMNHTITEEFCRSCGFFI